MTAVPYLTGNRLARLAKPRGIQSATGLLGSKGNRQLRLAVAFAKKDVVEIQEGASGGNLSDWVLASHPVAKLAALRRFTDVVEAPNLPRRSAQYMRWLRK